MKGLKGLRELLKYVHKKQNFRSKIGSARIKFNKNNLNRLNTPLIWFCW